MMNSTAINIGGHDAAMTVFERQLIEPALVRSMQRGGEMSERMLQMLDPLAMVMGIGMWGTRVMGVRQQRIQLARQGYGPMPPVEPPTPTAAQMTGEASYQSGNGSTEPLYDLNTTIPANVSSIEDLRAKGQGQEL